MRPRQQVHAAAQQHGADHDHLQHKGTAVQALRVNQGLQAITVGASRH